MKRFAQVLICSATCLVFAILIGCEGGKNVEVTASAEATGAKEYISAGNSRGKSLIAKHAALHAPPVSDVQRDSEIEKPTHRQSMKIIPKLDGQPIKLNTFCLANDGTILAACGGKQVTFKVNEKGDYDTVELDEPCVLLQLDSKGEQLNQWHLDFKPTAVNVAPNDDVFVAGTGQIARISDGKIVATGKAPHINDVEEFKAKALERAKRQMEKFAARMKEDLENLKKRIAKIEEVEEEDRTRIQKVQLEAFKQQMEFFEDSDSMPMDEPEAIVERAMEITSIAVSEQDVFWVCSQVQGHGYAIWRTDHEFSQGTEVIDGVNGCCGQMDIQCCDDHLVIAENTSYKVAFYDRGGKELTSFGSRDRSSKSGFGSCCNPMNVRTLPDGTILTAESSIGHIKRFDQEGKFLDYVGKAKVAGGCKHCAVGYDSNSDQYYMMHQDDSAILVLANKSSLSGQSEEQLLVTRLMEKFETRLVGTWQMEVKKDIETDKQDTDEEVEVADDVFYAMEPQGPPFESMNFHPDGKLIVTGGHPQDDSAYTWVPVKGENDELTVSILSDQVEMMPVSIKFGTENTASFSFRDYMGIETTKANRIKNCDGENCDGENCDGENCEVTGDEEQGLDTSAE